MSTHSRYTIIGYGSSTKSWWTKAVRHGQKEATVPKEECDFLKRMFEINSRNASIPLVVFKDLFCIYMGHKEFNVCSPVEEKRRNREPGSGRETLQELVFVLRKGEDDWVPVKRRRQREAREAGDCSLAGVRTGGDGLELLAVLDWLSHHGGCGRRSVTHFK